MEPCPDCHVVQKYSNMYSLHFVTCIIEVITQLGLSVQTVCVPLCTMNVNKTT